MSGRNLGYVINSYFYRIQSTTFQDVCLCVCVHMHPLSSLNIIFRKHCEQKEADKFSQEQIG